ncbi:MAG TPA: YggS family pyridoxal phosphate-dependent enzyme [Spirochaetia bacterium]|nr:YggS family pyridoxal phosphate-dependent enzyme [Spirochaetia bacterium]
MAATAFTCLGENLLFIKENVDRSLSRAGRRDTIHIMAVTKGHPREAWEAALDAGLTLFGENRVQEAEAKYGRGVPGGELHLIGHLQRNKARRAAELFACVQSIDKSETARELDRHASALGKTIPIFLEVNTSKEESKFGYADREALLRDLPEILGCAALRVAGLMTIGPLTDDEGAVRRAFSSLCGLFDELRTTQGLQSLTNLSMGMSHDYGIAIEEGATMIRIGTALFGKRPSA